MMLFVAKMKCKLTYIETPEDEKKNNMQETSDINLESSAFYIFISF